MESLCSRMVEGPRELSGASLLRTNPIYEGSTIITEALSKNSLPNIIILGIQHVNLGRTQTFRPYIMWLFLVLTTKNRK